jgi:hypothetical protein
MVILINMPPRIFNIWIIKKPSGTCLVDAKFQDLPTSSSSVDGNIMSGLLTAFSTFTEEILEEPIRIFETASYKICFYVESMFYVAMLADSRIPATAFELIAKRLAKVIPVKYPALLAEGFDGDLSPFESLKSDLETAAGLRGIKLIRFLRDKRKEGKALKKIQELQESISNLKESDQSD